MVCGEAKLWKAREQSGTFEHFAPIDQVARGLSACPLTGEQTIYL
jgi:hypothetical protein